MKKLFLACLMVLFLAVSVQAAPFVVCDKYTDPNAMPEEFIVSLNGAPETSIPYTEGPDYAIVFDLVGVPLGSHSITVKAKNEVGESEVVTLDFLLKGIPESPEGKNLRVLY